MVIFADMLKACQLLTVTKPCADFSAAIVWQMYEPPVATEPASIFGMCKYSGGSHLIAPIQINVGHECGWGCVGQTSPKFWWWGVILDYYRPHQVASRGD